MINLYQILMIVMLAVLIGAKIQAGGELNIDDFAMAAVGVWSIWRLRGKSKITMPPLWFWLVWLFGGIVFLFFVLKWKSELFP